jgi:hypothetical protein
MWRGDQPCCARCQARKRRASFQSVGVRCMQGGYHTTSLGLVFYAGVSRIHLQEIPSMPRLWICRSTASRTMTQDFFSLHFCTCHHAPAAHASGSEQSSGEVKRVSTHQNVPFYGDDIRLLHQRSNGARTRDRRTQEQGSLVNRALRSERTLLATGSTATSQGDLSKGCRIGCGMACRTPVESNSTP